MRALQNSEFLQVCGGTGAPSGGTTGAPAGGTSGTPSGTTGAPSSSSSSSPSCSDGFNGYVNKVTAGQVKNASGVGAPGQSAGGAFFFGTLLGTYEYLKNCIDWSV